MADNDITQNFEPNCLDSINIQSWFEALPISNRLAS